MPKASDKEKYLVETFIEKARQIVPNAKLRFALRLTDGDPGLRLGVCLPDGIRPGAPESFELHQLAEQMSNADQYLVTATMTSVIGEGVIIDIDFLPKELLAPDGLVTVKGDASKSTAIPGASDPQKLWQTIGIWSIVILAAFYVLRPIVAPQEAYVRVHDEHTEPPQSDSKTDTSSSPRSGMSDQPEPYELLSKRNQLNSSMIDLSSWSKNHPDSQQLSAKKQKVFDDFSNLKQHLTEYADELNSVGDSTQQGKVLNLKKTVEMIQPQ